VRVAVQRAWEDREELANLFFAGLAPGPPGMRTDSVRLAFEFFADASASTNLSRCTMPSAAVSKGEILSNTFMRTKCGVVRGWLLIAQPSRPELHQLHFLLLPTTVLGR
jgi:hypothetical protein